MMVHDYGISLSKIACFALFALVLAFAMDFGPGSQAFAASAEEAQANPAFMQGGSVLSPMASTNLKKAGMKFDLKNGKKRTVYAKVRGAGKIKYSVKMSKYKVKNLGNGYKKASFNITWKLKDKITSKKAKKILKALARQGYSWDYMETGYYMFFVDYVTGRNLEDPAYSNGFSIVKKKETNYKKTKKYHGSDDSYFYLGKLWTMKVAVTFPADYKNLCVGVGCGNKFSYDEYGTDWSYIDDYESGHTFYQTSWCKKCKRNFHFKRIK